VKESAIWRQWTFSLDAQKASFSAKNGRGRADGELLRRMAGRFLRHFAKKISPSLSRQTPMQKTESKAVQEEYI